MTVLMLLDFKGVSVVVCADLARIHRIFLNAH